MLNKKYDVFGVRYTSTNYETLTEALISHAKKGDSIGLTALAVHGLIESVNNKSLMDKVNKIHYIVPDGQPIKWFLNRFYKTGLKDRVYGPELTLQLLKKANINKLGIYLFGSTENTLSLFRAFIEKEFPNVQICGIHIDRFRDATEEEDKQDIEKIIRQEIWVSDHIDKIPAVMLAVGAAFDFHAGVLSQAPKWMQKNGLEWLYRLIQEPKRLWKRYVFTNSKFIFLTLLKIFKIKK